MHSAFDYENNDKVRKYHSYPGLFVPYFFTAASTDKPFGLNGTVELGPEASEIPSSGSWKAVPLLIKQYFLIQQIVLEHQLHFFAHIMVSRGEVNC